MTQKESHTDSLGEEMVQMAVAVLTGMAGMAGWFKRRSTPPAPNTVNQYDPEAELKSNLAARVAAAVQGISFSDVKAFGLAVVSSGFVLGLIKDGQGLINNWFMLGMAATSVVSLYAFIACVWSRLTAKAKKRKKDRSKLSIKRRAELLIADMTNQTALELAEECVGLEDIRDKRHDLFNVSLAAFGAEAMIFMVGFALRVLFHM